MVETAHSFHRACGEQSSGLARNLDSKAFALPAVDVDGLEVAALDLVQRRLAGHAQSHGRLSQVQPAVGNLGHDPAAALVDDAPAPEVGGGGLFALDETVLEPAINRALVHAEDLVGLIDGGHDAIIAGRCDSGARLEHGYAVGVVE